MSNVIPGGVCLKNIIFVSDLHLGDERFKEKPFLSFLDKYVSKKCSHLVIAGDLFELVQQEIERVLDKSQKVISKLWQLADKMKISYIPGNHDLYLAKFLFHRGNIHLAYPALTIKAGDRQIHVEHGHLQQAEYKNFPELYNDLARLGGFLNLFDPDLQNTVSHGLNALDKLKHNFSLAGKAKRLKHLDDFAAAALSLIRKGNDYVVFGHTHEPQEIIFDDKKYINIGDWVEHATYGEFEPESGEILLRE